MDHKAEAERLLAVADRLQDVGDHTWATAIATRALAHATLAGLLQPLAGPGHVLWPSPQIYCGTDYDTHDEPVIVFRGQDVRD